MAQTAEGALGEVTQHAAAHDANWRSSRPTARCSSSDIAQLQTEQDAAGSRRSTTSPRHTNFNGLKLLDGSAKEIKLQTGTNASRGDQTSVAYRSGDADPGGRQRSAHGRSPTGSRVRSAWRHRCATGESAAQRHDPGLRDHRQPTNSATGAVPQRSNANTDRATDVSATATTT